MSNAFENHRLAALALINSGADLREKEGNFLGGIAFRRDDMTDKQANWLRILLARHNLPQIIGEAVDA